MYKVRYKTHHDANRSLKAALTTTEDPYAYLYNKLNQEDLGRRVLYLHVPYCQKICSFCPFSKFSNVPKSEYDNYLIDQMLAVKDYEFIQSTPFESVYFGGGTPTALDWKQMDRVLNHIHKNFPLSSQVEISLESSITELNDDMLKVLEENGVNRLSIGVQTFNDKGRRLLNRRGNGAFAIKRLEKIKSIVKNTNIDLIYNYPGQDLEVLKNDIEIIKALDIGGLSFYSLMIHENTPLAIHISEKDRRIMSDLEREKHFFDCITNTLYDDGYEMFELTKLVKDKRDQYKYIEVKHDGGHCVPIGVKAGGRIGRYSYFNPENRMDFSDEIRLSMMGRMVSKEYLEIEKIINQLQHGYINLSEDAFVSRLIDLGLFNSLFDQLKSQELIKVSKKAIELTNEGFFFGNNIISDMAQMMVQHFHEKDIV